MYRPGRGSRVSSGPGIAFSPTGLTVGNRRQSAAPPPVAPGRHGPRPRRGRIRRGMAPIDCPMRPLRDRGFWRDARMQGRCPCLLNRSPSGCGSHACFGLRITRMLRARGDLGGAPRVAGALPLPTESQPFGLRITRMLRASGIWWDWLPCPGVPTPPPAALRPILEPTPPTPIAPQEVCCVTDAPYGLARLPVQLEPEPAVQP